MHTLAPILGTLREAESPAPSGSAEVVLITPGPGNSADGNLYLPSTVQTGVSLFDGVRSFCDHSTKTEETDRPERTIKEICGWHSNVRLGPDGQMLATFVPGGAASETARKTIESALQYQKQYPNKVISGFSINADGETHIEKSEALIQQYPQWADKLRQREFWNVVDGFTRVASVDLVTFPARGGKVLSMNEAEKVLKDKSAEVITDLRKKMDAVQESHKPETIAALLDALKAYLGEEEKEGTESKSKPSKEGESMATEAKKAATCEACGHKMEAKREAEESKKEEAGTEAEAGKKEAKKEEAGKEEPKKKAPEKKAAADDEPDEDDAPAKKKEADAVAMTLHEAEHEITRLRDAGQLVEADRLELASLRIERGQRTKRGKIEEALKEAGLDGVDEDLPDKLMAFRESQWPALIDVAQLKYGPTVRHGSGQINMPAPGARHATAVDAFNAAWENNDA